VAHETADRDDPPSSSEHRAPSGRAGYGMCRNDLPAVRRVSHIPLPGTPREARPMLVLSVSKEAAVRATLERRLTAEDAEGAEVDQIARSLPTVPIPITADSVRGAISATCALEAERRLTAEGAEGAEVDQIARSPPTVPIPQWRIPRLHHSRCDS
jgi:hypothetical protein